MRSIEGVVFDLDATLVNLGGFVDWKDAHRRVKEVYLECGCSEDFVERCSRKGLFNMLDDVWENLCASLPRDLSEEIQGKAYAVLTSCEREGIERCHLMPGCNEALNWLRRRGVKMGIVTSNSQDVANRILEIKGLREYFGAVVGRTPGLRMKPHPDQLIACFEMLECEPGRGAVIGDSVRDVEAAKSVGAYAIAVPSFFTERAALEMAGVDLIIDCLDKIPDVFSSATLRLKESKLDP
jgi:phosphoglycolate phosphatase-like HAD superfamily hydrolase